MTPEQIAKAREIIAIWDEGICSDAYLAAAARTGWPEALDEVERLRQIIAALPCYPDCGSHWTCDACHAQGELHDPYEVTELKELRAENERLTAAYATLKRFSDANEKDLRAENQHLKDDILKVNYSERLLLAEQVAEAAEKCVIDGCFDVDSESVAVLLLTLKAWRGEK